MESPLFWIQAALRLAGWWSLVGLGGAALWRLVIAPEAPTDSRLRNAPAATAGILLIAKLAQLWLQTRTFFFPDPVGLDELRLVVGSTAWGFGWSLQALAAVTLLLAGVAIALRDRGWVALAAAAAVAAASEPLTGHAADAGRWSWPWLLQALHVTGSLLWIGGLTLLVLHLARPGSLAPDTVRRRVDTFSPLALTGAGLLAGSGALTALEYVSALSQLWTTPWGRALVLKLVLVAGATALGAWNWRRLRPQLGEAAASVRLLRSASLELTLALLVLAVSAVLVALHLPTG